MSKRALADYLTDDYCAACDSFGHTERKEYGALWCNVCWDHAKPVPSSLRREIEALLDVINTVTASTDDDLARMQLHAALEKK